MLNTENLAKKLGKSNRINEPTNRKSIITVDNIHKQYGATIAVDNVSFSIAEGEIFGIIGPNGAGKTTTVECISGLRVPDSGSITVYGLNPRENHEEIRKIVGVQLQESSLPPRIKVWEALNLFASFYPDPLKRLGLIRSVTLDSNNYPEAKNRGFQSR